MRDYEDRGHRSRGGGGGRDRDRDRGGGGGGGSSYGGGSFEKPVKEGEQYDVTIEAVGAKGDGICKINNFVVFVPGVRAGDKVRVRIDKVLNRFALASLAGSATGETSVAAEEPSGDEQEGGSEEAQ